LAAAVVRGDVLRGPVGFAREARAGRGGRASSGTVDVSG
jgi:hypothetical protein